MEQSEFSPEEQNSSGSKADNIKDNDKKNEVEEFSELLENSNKEIKSESSKVDIQSNNKLKLKEKTVFIKILENGFDGITTNPNYKLLALLIILLVNLSLFFLIGSVGKTFLKNSGIL